MALIIDTMNVLHAWTTLRIGHADQTVSGLSRLIGTSRYAGRRVRMVCDGSPPPDWPARVELPLHATARVTAIYAGPGRDADSLIEHLLDEDPGVRHTLVISADRRLIKAARRRKAGSLGSAAFLHHLLADAREAGIPTPDPASRIRSAIPLAASTVEGWLRYFKIADPANATAHPSEASPTNDQSKSPPRTQPQPSHPRPIERLMADQRAAAPRAQPPKGSGRPTPRHAPEPTRAMSDPSSTNDPALDRLIREAIAGGTRIDPSELDMSKWLN